MTGEDKRPEEFADDMQKLEWDINNAELKCEHFVKKLLGKFDVLHS